MYQTKVLLDKLYSDTESFLDHAVKTWQNMPLNDFHKKANPESWSAAQCIEHLNMYGRYYIPALRKAIDLAENKGFQPNETYKSGWIGNYFYNLMLPVVKENSTNTEGVLVP